MAAAGRPETADSASSAAAATVTRTTKYSSLGLPGDSLGDPAVVTASNLNVPVPVAPVVTEI